MWDTREDGYIFRTYQKTKLTSEGFYGESWLAPDRMKEWYAKMQKASKATRMKVYQEIVDYKLEKGCADCGYKEHPAALDFDHLPGTTKEFNIGNAAGYYSDRKKIWDEVAKCEVVCANCHRIRTTTRCQDL